MTTSPPSAERVLRRIVAMTLLAFLTIVLPASAQFDDLFEPKAPTTPLTKEELRLKAEERLRRERDQEVQYAYWFGPKALEKAWAFPQKWRSFGDAPPVGFKGDEVPGPFGPKTNPFLAFDLPFESNPGLDEAAFEIAGEWDLSPGDRIAIYLKLSNCDAVQSLTLTFGSGKGEYSATFQPNQFDTTDELVCDREDFQSTGAPNGWAQLDRIRLTFERGKAIDAHALFRRLRGVRCNIGVLDSDPTNPNSAARRMADLLLSKDFRARAVPCAEFIREAAIARGNAELDTWMLRDTILIPPRTEFAPELTAALLEFAEEEDTIWSGGVVACGQIPDALAEAMGITPPRLKRLDSPLREVEFLPLLRSDFTPAETSDSSMEEADASWPWPQMTQFDDFGGSFDGDGEPLPPPPPPPEKNPYWPELAKPPHKSLGTLSAATDEIWIAEPIEGKTLSIACWRDEQASRTKIPAAILTNFRADLGGGGRRHLYLGSAFDACNPKWQADLLSHGVCLQQPNLWLCVYYAEVDHIERIYPRGASNLFHLLENAIAEPEKHGLAQEDLPTFKRRFERALDTWRSVCMMSRHDINSFAQPYDKTAREARQCRKILTQLYQQIGSPDGRSPLIALHDGPTGD